MDWITTDIAIGDSRDAEDVGLLQREGFGSILCLVSTVGGREPADLGLQRIEVVPLIDGPGNTLEEFQTAVAALERLLAEAPPVLVHCRAGWGRSPVVVAGYLMRTRGIGPDEALAEIAARRRISILRDMRALLDQFQERIVKPGC